ncbi:MAG TPA: elongation factor P maturation arginine rhamnosyltransferase EarP [Rhodocyclaceae bacterium]
MKARWDIFCTVVDNYGDIGVCWRLARQLAREHGIGVRLWVDDLAPLARLAPAANPAAASQQIEGVEVRVWPQDFPAVAAGDIPDVVIEAFACELPESYLAAMAVAPRQPVWTNLEYLSAEDWVQGCHGLASPHPRLPLTKHFFFPGFIEGTGGLLREADYAARRSAFDAAAFRRSLGLAEPAAGAITVSLFAYENAALGSLLSAWSEGQQPIQALVPEGRLLPQVAAWLGATPAAGQVFRRGALTLQVLPFLPQAEYDKLLWCCDLNFVRGEDSFVRAQWAAKPFVWHIYPQAEDHHRIKLAAFLKRYSADLDPETATAMENFWDAWEMEGDAGLAWSAFAVALPALQSYAVYWAERLAGRPDLASALVSFAIKSR